MKRVVFALLVGLLWISVSGSAEAKSHKKKAPPPATTETTDSSDAAPSDSTSSDSTPSDPSDAPNPDAPAVDDAAPEIPSHHHARRPAVHDDSPAPSTTDSSPSTTDSAPSTTDSGSSTTDSAPSTTDSASSTTDEAAPTKAPAQAGAADLNFDLSVGTPTTTNPSVPLAPPVDTSAIRTRRTMLIIHQTVGMALTAAMLGAMVTGQLSYNDKFDGPNTGKYELAHQLFVYPTEALGVAAAGLALFAPVPIQKENDGFDRMTVHKIGQFTAFAGWAAQLGLGLYTSSREGYANQHAFATAHMAVGYVALAGMMLGLGAIVF